MAYTDKKELYEVLVRFTDGAPTGAHVIWRKSVYDDGKFIAESFEQAPLSMENLADSEVMGDALKSALAQVNVLNDEKIKLINDVNENAEIAGAVITERDTLSERLGRKLQEIEALNIKNAELVQTLATANNNFAMVTQRAEAAEIELARIQSVSSGG